MPTQESSGALQGEGAILNRQIGDPRSCKGWLWLDLHILRPLAAGTYTCAAHFCCPASSPSEAPLWPRSAPRFPRACSHKKKRMKQIKKMAQRGLLDPESDDPFSLFVASTNIRYCYYADTHKILGNTFGMCVLQVRSETQRGGTCHHSRRRRAQRGGLCRILRG